MYIGVSSAVEFPVKSEYRTFQDYIFRFLVREGGRLHLPVHVHSAVGIGDYFSLSEGNILNLENIVRDPRYSSTVFVMIHGGISLRAPGDLAGGG